MSKLLQLAAHPDEVVPMLRMLAAARRAKALPALKSDPSLQFCYEMLNRVSRRYKRMERERGRGREDD